MPIHVIALFLIYLKSFIFKGFQEAGEKLICITYNFYW